MSDDDQMDRPQSDDFVQQAQEEQPGFVREFTEFLVTNKNWWITPIIVVLLVLALVAFLLNSPAAPFIYPM